MLFGPGGQWGSEVGLVPIWRNSWAPSLWLSTTSGWTLTSILELHIFHSNLTCSRIFEQWVEGCGQELVLLGVMCLCRVGAPFPVLGAPCAKRQSGCALFWEWVLGRALLSPDLQPFWSCVNVWHCVWLAECGTWWEDQRPPLLLLQPWVVWVCCKHTVWHVVVRRPETTTTTNYCNHRVVWLCCTLTVWHVVVRRPETRPRIDPSTSSAGSHLVTICWDGFGSLRSFSFSVAKIQFACLTSEVAYLLSDISPSCESLPFTPVEPQRVLWWWVERFGINLTPSLIFDSSPAKGGYFGKITGF